MYTAPAEKIADGRRAAHGQKKPVTRSVTCRVRYPRGVAPGLTRKRCDQLGERRVSRHTQLDDLVEPQRQNPAKCDSDQEECRRCAQQTAADTAKCQGRQLPGSRGRCFGRIGDGIAFARSEKQVVIESVLAGVHIPVTAVQPEKLSMSATLHDPAVFSRPGSGELDEWWKGSESRTSCGPSSDAKDPPRSWPQIPNQDSK